jgi:hypothetical protein
MSASNKLTYQIKDADGNLVYDGTNTVNELYDTTFATNWPGGYGVMTTRVKRDPRRSWVVAPNQTIIVYLGHRIIYQGLLEQPKDNISGNSSITSLTAYGFYTVLSHHRTMRKRWVHKDVFEKNYLEWPPDRENHVWQMEAEVEKKEDRTAISIVKRDTDIDIGERTYHLLYTEPKGTKIKKIEYQFYHRTGEILEIDVVNVDQSTIEATSDSTMGGYMPGPVVGPPAVEAISKNGTGLTVTHVGAGSSADLVTSLDLLNVTGIPIASGYSFPRNVQVGDSVIRRATGNRGTITQIKTVVTVPPSPSNNAVVAPLSYSDTWNFGNAGTIHIPVKFTAPFTAGDTESLRLEIGVGVDDTFDQKDITILDDVTVFAKYNPSHPDFGSEAYTVGEIVIDVLLEANDRISGDYDEIDDPATVLDEFITEGDTYQPLANIIAFLARFSNANQNTWGLAVWDETGTTDDKPKAEFKERLTDDWEYEVSFASGEFTPQESNQELFNDVRVSYIDAKNKQRFVISDDFPTLKDQTSIDKYGLRHSPVLDAGRSSEDNAVEIGERYLAYHANPIKPASFRIKSTIRKKGGEIVPVSYVSSGKRIKVIDWRTDENGNPGDIFFLRSTNYNSSQDTLTANSDIPPDALQTMFFQRSEGMMINGG